MSKRDVFDPVAESVPFDNDTNNFVSDDTQGAIEEVNTNLLDSASISCQWTDNGTASGGDFLKVGDTSGDDVGLLVPFDGTIVVFNAANDEDTGLKELEIIRRRPAQTGSDVVIATLSIPNGDYVGNSNPSVAVEEGDELLVKVVDSSADFDDVICSVVITKEVGGGGGPGSGSGETNTASNLGTGEGVFANKVGVDLQFKSITGSGSAVVTSNANEIDINVVAAGEANTSSNQGGGAELALAKSGVDLPFRTLVGTGAVTVTEVSNTLEINVPSTSVDPDVGKITTAVDVGGGQVVTAGALVTFDSTSEENTTIASHTPGGSTITINKTGVYTISAGVALNQTAGNSRSAANYEIRVNGTIVPGTAGFSYHRNNAQGEGSYSRTISLSLTSGDTVSLFASRNSGGATLATIANSATLSVVYLRSSN